MTTPIILEGGRATADPEEVDNAEWREGTQAEISFHAQLVEVAEPSMTLHDLHREMNDRILELGFENLDFHRNLGHSI